MDFLQERKSLPCRISGKAAAGEASSTMGDFRAKLADSDRITRTGKPQKDNPGTFFLDTASGQVDVRYLGCCCCCCVSSSMHILFDVGMHMQTGDEMRLGRHWFSPQKYP